MRPLYRHCDVALLRAAARPLDDVPDGWPDLSDPKSCRTWLTAVWARPDLVEAIRQASPALADQLDAIGAGRTVQDKQIRRATSALMRYVLRATGRHTPFGLFAGVAAVTLGDAAEVRWRANHRAFVQVDTQWLADLVERLERCPELLARLDVVFSTVALERGGRLEAPLGPNRVTVRCTSVVRLVRKVAATPIRFAELAGKVAEAFPTASPATIDGALAELVCSGVLITCLRAPMTEPDPLRHVVDRLELVQANTIAAVAPLLAELQAIQAAVHHHNHADPNDQQRTAISIRMRKLSGAGRTPLSVVLGLDCDVRLPGHVAVEVEHAAGALARLTRHPTGEAPWRDFYTAFCQRYGTGTLAPVTEVLNPDAGLGYPPGYPGSVLTPRTSGPSERDEKLLTLAWTATAEGSPEIVLDEQTIQALRVGEPPTELRSPPHVELAVRIHATSAEALQRGNYLLSVMPGRSAGTFTSRFSLLATGSVQDVYATVPTAVDGALPVQLSFPPAYPHAENICRVPAYLPDVLPLGEHRSRHDRALALDDLAVIATRDGLHLVSVSRQQVVEPQAFHGLALDKQPPPLARFLIHLSRGLGASWHTFDWGQPAQRLPYLPRVRYRRAILAPARWRLVTADLPTNGVDQPQWQQALDQWRDRWRCLDVVELNDADRTLRLSLNVPAHAALLRTHLNRRGHAILTETVLDASGYGWIGGYAHEVVLPLVTTRTAAPSPVTGARPVVTNGRHGQLPGSPDATWLNAKIYTHPERLDEIITQHLPRLLASLAGNPAYWFIRYRSEHETDHLRLRIRSESPQAYAAIMTAVGRGAHQLRNDGIAGPLSFETYVPEIGRYGDGPAMAAAEDVFVADSRAVATQLGHLPEAVIGRDALVAVNMLAIVQDFFADAGQAMRWLSSRPAPPAPAVDRATLGQVVTYTLDGTPRELPGWAGEVGTTWQARTDALAEYRLRLSADADVDSVLESLLHLHHNRAIGIDRNREAACHRLTRHAALAWSARHGPNR